MKKNLFVIAGIVAGLVLVCLVGWMIYASANRYGGDEAATSSRYLLGPGAAPEPQAVVVEKVIEVPAAESSAYDASGVVYAAERLIIRSGNISMVVQDTRAALATIEGMVESMAAEGAFVVSADEYGGTEGSQPYITISIRIPASRFDATMDRLAELAVNVTSRNESAQDVTEEYVDLEARLESLEAARQRLLEIMQEARQHQGSAGSRAAAHPARGRDRVAQGPDAVPGAVGAAVQHLDRAATLPAQPAGGRPVATGRDGPPRRGNAAGWPAGLWRFPDLFRHRPSALAGGHRAGDFPGRAPGPLARPRPSRPPVGADERLIRWEPTMNRHDHLRLAALLATLLLLAACGPAATPAPGATATPQAAASLEGTEWALFSLQGSPLLAGTHITLSFRDGQAGGFAGCNAYGGGYEATQEGTLSIPEMAITAMACPSPEGVMDQEQAYVRALGSAATYLITNGHLEIENAAGETVLVFSRQEAYEGDPAGLVGTAWRLVSLDGQTPIAGSILTLAFHDERLVSGHAGCRDYLATYQAEGGDLGFPYTAMMGPDCAEDALLLQEGALHHGARLDGPLPPGPRDQLELSTIRGEILAFEPLPGEAQPHPGRPNLEPAGLRRAQPLRRGARPVAPARRRPGRDRNHGGIRRRRGARLDRLQQLRRRLWPRRGRAHCRTHRRHRDGLPRPGGRHGAGRALPGACSPP